TQLLLRIKTLQVEHGGQQISARTVRLGLTFSLPMRVEQNLLKKRIQLAHHGNLPSVLILWRLRRPKKQRPYVRSLRRPKKQRHCVEGYRDEKLTPTARHFHRRVKSSSLQCKCSRTRAVTLLLRRAQDQEKQH